MLSWKVSDNHDHRAVPRLQRHCNSSHSFDADHALISHIKAYIIIQDNVIEKVNKIHFEMVWYNKF